MHYEITVKGDAHTNYPHKQECHGIDCQDNFAEYFDDELQHLAKDIKRGYLSFEYQDGVLYAVTKYISTRPLDNDEMFMLLEYTIGQWSDGIGEGFEQQPLFYGRVDEKDVEVYISPWHQEQIANISQQLIEE